MSKFWSKGKKKAENEKVVISKSNTSDGHVVHSSVTSITRQQITTHTTERRTTTSVQKIERNSPFASESSLNSFTKNSSQINSNLQKFEDGNLLTNFCSSLAQPKYNSSVSIDAIPFKSVGVYKSSPPRSAFSSTPLTTSSSTPINLNYQSPYNNSRVRSTSVASPISTVGNTQLSSFTSRPKELPKKISNTKSEEFRQKIKVSVKRSSKFYDDPLSKVPIYPTRSKRRGRLLVINNIKFVNENEIRKGAELDEEHVVQLFKQMGFEVDRSRNLSKKEMEKKIVSFRGNSSLKNVDIGAVIVMSHGTGKESSGSTEVVCTDGKLLQTTWIINQFDSTVCPYLNEKPKIFIFQCCRGAKMDIVHDSVVTDGPRKLSDMLIAYSTIPGFVSHRDPENGTWYIQAICKVFMEHAHDTDVESLLKIVDNNLSTLVFNGSKQTSSFENRGFKTCYLHPQLYQ